MLRTLTEPPYLPTLDRGTRLLLAAARRRCAARDAAEARAGALPPAGQPLYLHLRTVVDALALALARGDWDLAAEACCLVQDAEGRCRPDGE